MGFVISTSFFGLIHILNELIVRSGAFELVEWCEIMFDLADNQHSKMRHSLVSPMDRAWRGGVGYSGRAPEARSWSASALFPSRSAFLIAAAR